MNERAVGAGEYQLVPTKQLYLPALHTEHMVPAIYGHEHEIAAYVDPYLTISP